MSCPYLIFTILYLLSGSVIAPINNFDQEFAGNYDSSTANFGQRSYRENNEEPTNFELKATMSKCVRSKIYDGENTFKCSNSKSNDLKTKDYRTKCQQQEDGKVLTKCDKKIVLTLKVKNKGLTSCKPQYIILDHVFDPNTEKKQKLLNPYVLKIVQRPVLQVYDLTFENVINSGPTERVINKNNEGFLGCTTDSENPTCGSVKYNNKQVPYSSGFCCSCSSSHNRAELLDKNVQSSNSIPYSSNKFKKSNEEIFQIVKDPAEAIPITNFYDDITPNQETSFSFLPDYYQVNDAYNGVSEKIEDVRFNGNLLPGSADFSRRYGRQSNSKTGQLHKRGGQDCSDPYIPPGVNPESYHDSAHCMEFSEVWYSMYRIAHPANEHSLDIQIFEKIGLGANRFYWREVTAGRPISVGTSQQRYSNNDDTILAYYSVNSEIESEFALDCKVHRLLIPEISGIAHTDNSYPEIMGGPGEFLVIRESEIDLTGKTCNKAGVGYEAFSKQPNKCEKDRGACLENQPKHMWQHDHDLEAHGQKGCYFLRNFGLLPDNPVLSKPCNGSKKQTQNKLLTMYYLPVFTSNININFAADMNAMLVRNSLAMITEVYTETLNPKRVAITAKILNSGMVTGVFYVGIGACPLEIPASFASISSQPVRIAPQHQHIFTLEIYCELLIKHFYCSLEVFNMHQQLIAVRRIRFERSDRCFCMWHCQCLCFKSDYSLKCTPLEIEQYHAAGFQGGMPVSTQVVHFSSFDDTVSVFLHIILYFCLTLWYMGLMKALIGCCILPIGLWGLEKILDIPKKLNRYFEPELKDEPVVYDQHGWPIHPVSGKRVYNIPPPTQFIINMVFFFIFPFAILWNLCKKTLEPRFRPDESLKELDICKCSSEQMKVRRNSSMNVNNKNKSKKVDFNSRKRQSKDGSQGTS
ncbi:hypothetical protein ABEB36_014282 [Hypothenemus hampei]|uniref:Generative cell specific-1/HAP2 domain-containing protein n=1 Tax=Hypothenemus hampei TaxID=57062 RepID=A0ABD1E463_HYPHA